MARKTEIDYSQLEVDWRAGVKPADVMAKEYRERNGRNVTGHTISKHFRKIGIERDLQEKIRAKAESLVTKELVTGLVTKKTVVTNYTDTEIIDAAANHSAQIQITERRDVAKARSISMALLSELESQVTDKELYQRLGEILDNQDDSGNSDKMRRIYSGVISFGGRVDNMKKAAESLKTLIDLERKIHKIDEQVSEHETYEDYLRRMRG